MSFRAEFVALCALAVVSVAAGCGSESESQPQGAGGSGAASAPVYLPMAAARACALMGSCLSSPAITRGAACVNSLEHANLAGGSGNRLAECAAKAANCEEMLSCASYGHGPDYCAANPMPTCDGDVVVSCPSELTPNWAIESTDCTSLGMKCSAGHCTDGNSCKGPIVLNCNGNRLTACDLFSDIQSSVDCTTVYPGGSCGALYSTVECLPPKSEQCPSATPPYDCSGNTLLGCAGPKRASLDCNALDSDCGSDGQTFAFDCVPRAKECTRTSPEMCHGTAYSVCVDGRYQDVDCASLGLGPCQVTADGAACSSPSP